MSLISDYFKLTYHQKHYSQKDIERYQLEAIKKLVRYAVEKSSYYRNSLKDLTLDSLDDFRAFPIINKNILMSHFDDINTVGIPLEDVKAYAVQRELEKAYLGYYKDQFVIGLSSGTSGNKGIFITDKNMTKRLPGVFLARSGLGLRALPMRILFCLRVFSQGFEDINAPFIKLKYQSTMVEPLETIQTINHNKINILMAPPSFLNVLLPFANQIKRKLKKIVTYAEVLTKEDKARFESIFHTSVIEIYQASEGQMASPCSYGKLHINEDLVHIDIYDKDNQLVIKPHVVGHKMVVTNLVNHAQPLIRYEMNDMIVLDDPCPCGSHFRTIEKIIGRQDDTLYFYDDHQEIKVVYPDLFARWIITESDFIREFQVVQDKISDLSITIDVLENYDAQLLKERIIRELKALHLHSDIHIAIGILELPKHHSKFKRFISHIS